MRFQAGFFSCESQVVSGGHRMALQGRRDRAECQSVYIRMRKWGNLCGGLTST